MYSSNITEGGGGGGGGFSLFNVKLYDAAVSYGNNNYISLGNTHTYNNRMVEGKYIFVKNCLRMLSLMIGRCTLVKNMHA